MISLVLLIHVVVIMCESARSNMLLVVKYAIMTYCIRQRFHVVSNHWVFLIWIKARRETTCFCLPVFMSLSFLRVVKEMNVLLPNIRALVPDLIWNSGLYHRHLKDTIMSITDIDIIRILNSILFSNISSKFRFVVRQYRYLFGGSLKHLYMQFVIFDSNIN